MKIIEPKVELLSEIGITLESHIARCIRLCYGKKCKKPNQEIDKKIVKELIHKRNLSMLRHVSKYLDIEGCSPDFLAHITNSNYWNYNLLFDYASTNLQEFTESDIVKLEPITFIENEQFLEECSKIPYLFELYRLTFVITTQISTAREFRENQQIILDKESQKYYTSKDGLLICKPWWYDGDSLAHDMYNANIEYLETAYKYLIGTGMEPNDAKGILPLDTATKVIYTYSIREWEHILSLKLYGKDNSNWHIIMNMIKNQINNFAKEHNINYKV